MLDARLRPSTVTAAPAEPCPLTAEQAAAAASVPLRTLRRWLDRWAFLGVAGIRRVRARAHAGRRWEIAPDLVDRWRRGELPSPHQRAA